MNKRKLITDRERAWKDADDWYEKYLLEKMHTSRLESGPGGIMEMKQTIANLEAQLNKFTINEDSAMPKATIELEYEQIDAIILNELKSLYEQLLKDWHNNVAVYDTRDELWNTITSFERVIEYFMVHSEFEEYMSNLSMRPTTSD